MCYVLIPILGVVGAAIARIFLYATSFFYSFFEVRMNIKVSFDKEALWKALVASVVMAVAILIIQLYCAGRVFIPLYICVGGLIYLGSVSALRGIHHNDIGVLRGILPNRLKWIASIIGRLASD
jgi:O-antigen/teichoic acid export membrane protein